MSKYTPKKDLLMELAKYNNFAQTTLRTAAIKIDEESDALEKLKLLDAYNKQAIISKEQATIIDGLAKMVKIQDDVGKGSGMSDKDRGDINKLLEKTEKNYEELLIKLYNEYIVSVSNLGDLGDIKCPTSKDECTEILKRIRDDEFVKKHSNDTIKKLNEKLKQLMTPQNGGYLNKYEVTPQNYKNMAFW